MKFFIILAFMLLSFTTANAQISCQTNDQNMTHCIGTDEKGNHINITSQVDDSGNVQTIGTIGDTQINTTSYADDSGAIQTTGTIGDTHINTSSHADDSGNVQTSGTVGNTQVTTSARADASGNIQTSGTVDGAHINTLGDRQHNSY